MRIEYRFGAGDAESSRKYAAELLALAPDVMLASGASTLAPLLRATRSVPIVFVGVSDPVGGGFVAIRWQDSSLNLVMAISRRGT